MLLMVTLSPIWLVVYPELRLPVHGNAGEEEDGTVEVEVEEEPDKAAHEVSEHPAVP